MNAIAKHGFAISRDELGSGLVGFAARIPTDSSVIEASITLLVEDSKYELLDEQHVANLVMAQAAAISLDLKRETGAAAS
ncbi:MAG: hypothetical protein AB7E55_29375 [Pigmentiphaga sp.]